jgi:hypothetical protein
LGEHKVRPYGHSPSIRLSRLLFSRLLSFPAPCELRTAYFFFTLSHTSSSCCAGSPG